MTQRGQTYAAALKTPRPRASPRRTPLWTWDGTDSAHKLAILAALAFGQRVEFSAIAAQGIDTLDSRDITYGDELGYVVKLLAIAHRQEEASASACGRRSSPRATRWRGCRGRSTPSASTATPPAHTMYYGRGAGGMPTASAVVADLVALATAGRRPPSTN